MTVRCLLHIPAQFALFVLTLTTGAVADNSGPVALDSSHSVACSSVLPAKSRPASTIKFFRLKSDSTTAAVDSILDTLGIPVNRHADIEIAYLSKLHGIRVKVDREFIYNNRRYIIIFSDIEPLAYNMLRLHERKGSRLIQIMPGEEPQRIAEAILGGLKIPYSYGEHSIVIDDANSSTQGFLFQPLSCQSGQVLLSEAPVGVLSAFQGRVDK